MAVVHMIWKKKAQSFLRQERFQSGVEVLADIVTSIDDRFFVQAVVS